MNEEELAERIGQLADEADNYLGFAQLPTPADMKVDGMKHGLEEISIKLKQLYVELTGDNVWEL